MTENTKQQKKIIVSFDAKILNSEDKNSNNGDSYLKLGIEIVGADNNLFTIDEKPDEIKEELIKGTFSEYLQRNERKMFAYDWKNAYDTSRKYSNSIVRMTGELKNIGKEDDYFLINVKKVEESFYNSEDEEDDMIM